jgi:hypothetical protein
MLFTAQNIFDWRDREYRTPDGTLTFRLYEDGWLVRYTPFDVSHSVQKVEGQEVGAACYFANQFSAREFVPEVFRKGTEHVS